MKKTNPELKYVRVDHRTVIEVPVSIPNETAINEHRLKLEENERKHQHYKLRKRWE